MRKTIFLSILLISLTSCSIDFNGEETDKKIEPINNSPSCATFPDYLLYCVWGNGTCKKTHNLGDNKIWEDCGNALK